MEPTGEVNLPDFSCFKIHKKMLPLFDVFKMEPSSLSASDATNEHFVGFSTYLDRKYKLEVVSGSCADQPTLFT